MKGQGRPKIRRNWGAIKPYEKIKQNDKLYDRSYKKHEIKRALQEGTQDGGGEGVLGETLST